MDISIIWVFSPLGSRQADKEANQADYDDQARDKHPKIDAHDQTAFNSVAFCRLRILKEVARADQASVHISVEKRQDPSNTTEAAPTFGGSVQHHPRIRAHVLVDVIDASNGKNEASERELDLPREHELLSNIRCLTVVLVLNLSVGNVMFAFGHDNIAGFFS